MNELYLYNFVSEFKALIDQEYEEYLIDNPDEEIVDQKCKIIGYVDKIYKTTLSTLGDDILSEKEVHSRLLRNCTMIYISSLNLFIISDNLQIGYSIDVTFEVDSELSGKRHNMLILTVGNKIIYRNNIDNHNDNSAYHFSDVTIKSYYKRYLSCLYVSSKSVIQVKKVTNLLSISILRPPMLGYRNDQLTMEMIKSSRLLRNGLGNIKNAHFSKCGIPIYNVLNNSQLESLELDNVFELSLMNNAPIFNSLEVLKIYECSLKLSEMYISMFLNLKIIMLRDNQINGLVNISHETLLELHLAERGATSITLITPQLTKLYISHTRIISLGECNNLPKLTQLEVSNDFIIGNFMDRYEILPKVRFC